MSKINEYPQAVTINNNDLFVIDQESGGDHATKSASVSQIAEKATSGVQTQIGSLSQLTTSDKSSLVGAVNEVNGKFSGYAIKEYTDTMPTSISNKVVQVDSGVDFAYLIGASVYNSASTRYECLQIGTEMASPDVAHINMLKNNNGTLSLRLFIDGSTGLSVFNGATVKAICLVKYS